MSADAPRSPCVSVCSLNAAGVCVGCYRSADEITDWLMAAAEEKRAILRRAEQRRRAAQPVRLL